MSGEKRLLSRRDFIKAAGAAGLGSALVPISSLTAADVGTSTEVPEQMVVPTRPFGKTGVDVSILSLGGILKKTPTSSYSGRPSNRALPSGILPIHMDGEATKRPSGTTLPSSRRRGKSIPGNQGRQLKHRTIRKLNTSLQRIILPIRYALIHYVDAQARSLTLEVKAWAESAKSKGTIRLFRFSAHKNMENSMLAAAKLGWVDGIMMSYNYRLMVKDEMKRAVDACAKAGIGLTAMKTH